MWTYTHGFDLREQIQITCSKNMNNFVLFNYILERFGAGLAGTEAKDE